MSETTFRYGEVPICPHCELKHLTDTIAHSEGSRKQILKKMQKQLAKLYKVPLKKYEQVREVEHILDDVQTVLRDIRHNIEQVPSEKRKQHVNPHNPRKYEPYGKTECEIKHPKILKKRAKCAGQIEKKQKCPPSEWGTSKTCVNPYAICRASIPCP